MIVKGSWWESPLCIADFGLGGLEDDIETGRFDFEGIARRKAELGFNAEHFGPFHFGGGEKGIFYFQSKSALKMPADILKDYLPLAHRNGIKVLIYLELCKTRTRKMEINISKKKEADKAALL